MKRNISLVLSILLLLSALAGCQSATVAPSASVAAASPEATIASTPSPAATTAVTVENAPTLVYYVAGSAQPDIASVMTAVNELLVPQIGAKIDMRILDWGAYKDRLTMMTAAGESFDLCFSGWLFPADEAAKNGTVLQLDELMEKNAPLLKSSIPEYLWKGIQVDGKIYAVPNEQIEAGSVGVCIRKDLAEKYKLDVDSIHKFADLEPFWIQIRDNEPDLIPFQMNGASRFWDMTDDIKSNSSYFGSAITFLFSDKKFHITATMPGFKEAAQKAYDFAQKGYFRKDLATVQDDSSDMAIGRYATYQTWPKPGVEAEEKLKTGHDYIVKKIDLPSIVGEGTLRATTTSISSKTKYPVESIKFLEAINTDKDIYNTFCFGIKDKHYTFADADHVQVNATAGYAPNTAWEFGNQFNALVQVGQSTDVWQKTKEENANAVKSPLLGILFKTDEVTTEIAQVVKVQNEYWGARIDKGTYAPDTYWQEYLDNLDKAGIQKIIDCYQKQVDEFLSK